MRSVCPLARSNCGANSSMAAFIAVVIRTLSSAACAPDIATSSSPAANAVLRVCMACSSVLPREARGLAGLHTLRLDGGRSGRRGKACDHRLAGLCMLDLGRDAAGVDCGLLYLDGQRADHIDASRDQLRNLVQADL